MKILVTSKGLIVASGYNFIFGAWDEQDKYYGTVVRKWKRLDESGNVLGYMLDENPRAITGAEKPYFSVVEIEEFPEDYVTGKYLYIDGAFTLNPDWVEPEPTLEEEVETLKKTIAAQAADIQLLNDTLLEVLMG